MEHKCCEVAKSYLRHDRNGNCWYIGFCAPYTPIAVQFCPWCGERLSAIMGVTSENAKIVARWIDQHVGEKVTYQNIYLSLVGIGGLLEHLGVVEPV